MAVQAPLISIIIPTFNSESTVAVCLKSLTDQSFKNYEVIVVDGASKDGTIEKVNELKNKFSKFILISEKDNGIYDALNKGIERSTGDWVYILGSDDELFDPNTLEKMAQHLQQTKAEVVYGNVKVVGDSAWAKDGQVHDGEFDLEKLLQHNICQQSIFYKRSIFGTIGTFDHTYPICGDWDLILRCAAKYELKYVDMIIAKFNAGGASTVRKEEKFYDEYGGNMYKYFGFKIFRKEFKPVAYRFIEYSNLQKKKGKNWSAYFYKWVYNSLMAK